MKCSSLLRKLHVRRGSTRLVILVGDYAIKIAWGRSTEHWLRGLLANIIERKVSKVIDSPHITRCYWRSVFGFISVHERVLPARHSGLWQLDLATLVSAAHDRNKFWWLDDANQSNFGYRGQTLVKLDYGGDAVWWQDTNTPLL